MGPPPSLNLPPIRHLALSNGIKVLLMEKHAVPLVQVNLVIRAGAFMDPEGKSGLAGMTASMLAERDGHYVLARTYAEKAKVQYEELADRANVGRLMNNLGAVEFLLGKPEVAVEHFKEAFAVALELGRDEEAATAVSSLAQVHLRTGDVKKAEEQAVQALEIIGEREDMLDEVGNARLVLGRALLEQDRLDEAETAFTLSEDAFARLSSTSHRAAAWVAQGDLATRRGDERGAAVLYRRAAESLQDFRF